MTERVLQEYLQALAEEQENPSEERAKQLLISYAEFHFRTQGGSQCPLCRASVRHVLPVSVTHKNGKKTTFPCLCQRCIEAEKGEAESIEIGMDGVTYSVKARRK